MCASAAAMGPVARKTPSVGGKVGTKDVPATSGKENVRPSASGTTTGRVSFAASVEALPKVRLSFASKTDRKGESSAGGRRSRIFSDGTFPSKRTPFHVHHDQKNDPAGNRGAQRPRKPVPSTVDSAATLQPRKQPPRGAEPSKIPRKRSTISRGTGDDEPRAGRTPLPSRIPRRSRSASVRPKLRSRSIDVQRPTFESTSSAAAAAAKRAESGLPEIRRQSEKEEKQGGAKRSRRLAFGGPSKPETNAIKKNARPVGCGSGERKKAPPPLPPPPPSPLDGAPRTKVRLAEPRETIDDRLWNGFRDFPRESFPAELLLHAEYHNDLPVVEREREHRSPRLSDNFLEENVNAEQRKLVVTFLIHLGIHCRHPSYVIYQAVKLFDAAIDRLEVETRFIQLTALASLWIVLKKQETFPKIPTAGAMIALAKDLYADREDLLIACERKILLALDFNVVFADAFSLFTFHLVNCKRFVDISGETTAYLYNCGGYVIDVTLLDEEFCRRPASLVAVTAAETILGLVLDDVPDRARPRWLFWRGLLFAGAGRAIGRFQDEEIDRCRVAMLRRVNISGDEHCGFEVVYRKYNRSKYGRISRPFLERVNRVTRVDVETYDP